MENIYGRKVRQVPLSSLLVRDACSFDLKHLKAGANRDRDLMSGGCGVAMYESVAYDL